MLDPQFNLVDALLAHSDDVLQAATITDAGGGTRLRYEAVLAGTEWRRLVAAAVRHLRRRGFGLQVEHKGLEQLRSSHLDAANRVSVALVILGLYMASSLLMQHSFGPLVGGYPLLSAFGYSAAIWLTVRLLRAIGRQPAATLFYHSHVHERTAEQVYSGLAGVLIVTDELERSLALPSRYGVDDLPVVIQDREFRDGRLVLPTGMMAMMQGRRGDTILANGTPHAFVKVPAGRVRLRLVNGSNARIYQLSVR